MSRPTADRGGRGSRARWVGVWLISSVVIAAAAFAVSPYIVSPWSDAAANSSRSPTASVEAVEHTFTADTVTATGQLSLGTALDIPAPSGITSTRIVVTDNPLSRDDTARNGDVIAGVSGQPVFALALEIPLYRDLEPGMSGPDVASLQESLTAASKYSGAIDGEYGGLTSAGVRQLYRDAEYDPPADVPYPQTETSAGDGADSRSDVGGESEAGAGTSGEAGDTDGELEVAKDTPLPMSAVVDVPEQGATVLKTRLLGDIVPEGEWLVQMRTGAAAVTARIPAADGARFAAGAPVTVAFPGSPVDPVEGKVASLSDFLPGDEEGNLPGYDVVVELDATELAEASDGMSAVVTPADSGEQVTATAVPLTALREDAAGTYVLLANDAAERVDVVAGVQGDGYVEIGEGSVLPGDSLLVGEPTTVEQ